LEGKYFANFNWSQWFVTVIVSECMEIIARGLLESEEKDLVNCSILWDNCLSKFKFEDVLLLSEIIVQLWLTWVNARSTDILWSLRVSLKYGYTVIS